MLLRKGTRPARRDRSRSRHPHASVLARYPDNAAAEKKITVLLTHEEVPTGVQSIRGASYAGPTEMVLRFGQGAFPLYVHVSLLGLRPDYANVRASHHRGRTA